jgi:hypothetical protein
MVSVIFYRGRVFTAVTQDALSRSQLYTSTLVASYANVTLLHSKSCRLPNDEINKVLASFEFSVRPKYQNLIKKSMKKFSASRIFNI